MTLKIKRIKKSLLDELGDGFEALTEAEATEAGFTLADDEVIVVEKPQPVQPPAGESADVTDLRNKLHTVNSESAQRRVALKEAATKIQALEQENATLKSNVATAKQSEAKRKATELFNKVAENKKYVFAAPQAAEDAREEIFAAIDWQKEVTEEILTPLVDGVVTKKPYVLKQAALGSTDGGRQGAAGAGDGDVIDLAEVAQSFNLPLPKTEKKEGS